jgi:hypothetical protein
MAVVKDEHLRDKTTAAFGLFGRTTAVAALAAAAVGLGGCGIVPGVGNSDLPVGTPFEGATTAECYPPDGDPEKAIWRTGQVEFVPIRRERDGRFFIPEKRKNQLIEVCFQSTAHLVVYLVPENSARRDAWINSVEIVSDGGSEPPGGEFTTDDPGLTARKVVDVGRRGAAATGCPVGETIVGQRRHVVVFNRNTTAATYRLRICVEDESGNLHLLDPRIRNGGRRN